MVACVCVKQRVGIPCLGIIAGNRSSGVCLPLYGQPSIVLYEMQTRCMLATVAVVALFALYIVSYFD